MKIGLALGFFDFRNDVRTLIATLLKEHEVVVFCQSRHAATVSKGLPPGAELRVIDEHPGGMRETLLEKTFQLFKRLPASRRNHYLMERFKIASTQGTLRRAYARFMLDGSLLLPGFLPYDRYLDTVRYTAKTEIEDIDFMLFFTEIVDDRLLARFIREDRNAAVYVYSWDHPCKHVRFTKRVRHLVWSADIGGDLAELQDVPRKLTHVLGATQLGFLEMASHAASGSPRPGLESGYIYFGCSIGLPELVAEEVAIIRRLVVALDDIGSPWKVLVRPYPVLSDWSHYESLGELDRIEFDDRFRTTDLSVREDDILEKYQTLKDAVAFFHLGTTLGFECCYTETPSFIIDYGFAPGDQALSLRSFVHQYQLEKYLLRPGELNVIQSDQQLREALIGLGAGREPYLAYNRAVAAGPPLKSFGQIAHDLADFAAGEAA